MVGSTVGNMVSAKTEDVVRGLSGQRGNAGQSSWRMSANLAERNRLLKENQNDQMKLDNFNLKFENNR
jgi:hypothetical protein